MSAALIVLSVVLVLVLTAVVRGLRLVQQYEQGVVFRLGRISGVKGPGLRVIIPFIDRLQKVNMQIVTMGVPGQDGISRDNVTVRVDAVVYFRVMDPVKAIVNVQNYLFAVSQVAQTSLRSVIGRSDLDQLLSDRDRINAELRAVIDEPTEGPWGVKIERVEVKDVALPDSMKRSMSRQAEAERERRARIIAADGELQASVKLAQAGRALSNDPSGLQLRLLQTVVEVAAEKNSTLVMPFPVEMLRFFERAAGQGAAPAGPEPLAAPNGNGSVRRDGRSPQGVEPTEQMAALGAADPALPGSIPAVEIPPPPEVGASVVEPLQDESAAAGARGSR